jgi:hypothetical protein
MGEVDLVPSQGAKLRNAQTVPISHQDHGGVAQAIAPPTFLGGSDQTLYLLGREILACPETSRLKRLGGGTVPFIGQWVVTMAGTTIFMALGRVFGGDSTNPPATCSCDPEGVTGPPLNLEDEGPVEIPVMMQTYPPPGRCLW